MRRRCKVIAVVACALLTVVACAACDADDHATPAPVPTPTGTPEAPELHATLTQSRIDEGSARVNAEVTNAGSTDVTVVDVAMDTTLYTSLPPTPKDTVFEPGHTIDLAFTLGSAQCGDEVTDDAPTFALHLADGTALDVPLDAAGRATLLRFHARDCALAHVNDIASIRWGASFRRTTIGGELFLRGDLVLRRPAGSDGAATLAVRGLEGSVLVRVLPDGNALPAVLKPGQGDLRVPVLFGAFRCDQHARAGSQQTFLLSTFVQTAELPEQRIIVIPGKHLQVQTLTLIDASCT